MELWFFRLHAGRTTPLTFILTRPLGGVTVFSVLRLQRAAIAVLSIWGQAPNARFLYGEPTQHVLYVPLPSPAAHVSTTNHRLFPYWGGREGVLLTRQALMLCRCLLIKMSLKPGIWREFRRGKKARTGKSLLKLASVLLLICALCSL